MGFPGQLDGYQSYFGQRGFVEPPSVTLRKKGFEYLDELLQDTHLSGQLEVRFRAAVNPGFQIDPASNAKRDVQIADFVKSNFDQLEDGPITVLQKIWSAIPYGFSLSEPIFERVTAGQYQNQLRLARVRHIPVKYVRLDFATDGTMKRDGVVLYSNGAQRQLDKTAKHGQRYRYADFLHGKHGATDNPYGLALTLKCALPTWIKREGLKFWAHYAETFGAPAIKVTLPATSSSGTDSSGDEAKVRNMLANYRAEGGMMVPKGFQVELLEAMRSGDPTYATLMEFCNREISKQIVGATLATEAGGKNSGASYALGAQHGQVSETVAYTDALWLEYLANQLIRRLVKLNFDTDQFPSFRILEDNWKDMIAMAQVIQPLLTNGFKIPAEWAHRRLGLPAAAPGEPLLVPVTTDIAATPAGSPDGKQKPDNNLRQAAPAEAHELRASGKGSSDFAGDPVSGFESALAATIQIDKLASASLFNWLQDVTDKYIAAAGKISLGHASGMTPPAINPGQVKRTLMSAALLYYLTAKREDYLSIAERLPKTPALTNPALPAAFRPQNAPEKAFQLAQAVRNFASAVPLSSAEINALSAAYEAQFHEIAGLVKSDMEAIWQRQLAAWTEPYDLRMFEQAVRSEVIRYAGEVYRGAGQPGDPLLGRHLELIYRNGMNKAYSEGEDALAQDPDVAPYLWGFQYHAILDDRVRPDHAEWEGVVLAADHPAWLTRTPPWDHNCRCNRTPILIFDIEDGLYIPTPEAQLPDFTTPPASGFVR